jgi:sortilin-related receptor
VSWSPPAKPNGHLDGYTVYHRPQLQSDAKVQINRVGAAENSLIIESDFRGNVTYEVWVKARNRRQESMSSKLVQITFDGTSNIDQISGLAMADMTETSMTLSWNKIPKAEGYIVQLVLPHPYPRIEAIRTKGTSVKIDNLVNGAQYVARVCAYVGNFTGRSQSLILKRNGTPLPEIQGIETKREGDHIRISWKRAIPMKNEKIEYGIYYGVSLEDLFDFPKKKTTDNTFLLTELNECQSYLIAVGIVGPTGPGPLGKNPRAIETHYSERKPPRNVAVSFDESRQTMDITWDHSCPLLNSNFPDYIVSQFIYSMSTMYIRHRQRIKNSICFSFIYSTDSNTGNCFR